jgi:CDP-diacylglycerol--serine O-phosphatidyltransferase
MSSLKRSIPSFFTSLGLFSGCIAIVISTTRGDLILSGWFILAAALFDFIDGFTARLMKHISEFGKQLDSLADVVSFGVAPAMILYRLMLLSYVESAPGSDFNIVKPPLPQSIIMYSAFLVAVFSAIRLARFNNDSEQTMNFKGLPTPANALLIVAFGFISESSRFVFMKGLVYHKGFLLGLIAVSCFLLVSNIRMFSLKFSTWTFRENAIRYLFLLFALVFLLLYGIPGLAPVIVLYVILSLINNRMVRMH